MKTAAIAWKLAIAAVVLSSSFACGGAAQKSPPAGVEITNRATAPRVSFVKTLPGRDPQLRWDERGNLHLLAVEEGAGRNKIVYRRLGHEPAGPVDVSPADLEVTAHGETPPAFEILSDGTMLAAYPVSLPGKWKGELRLQRSTDRGATWSAPRLLHPQRHGAHSFLSSAALPHGGAAFAWLDDSGGRQGLRFATTRDGQEITQPTTLDPKSCECCATTLVASERGLSLVYRDVSDDELRDFFVFFDPSARGEFGRARAVSRDGWRIAGCPHTGARLIETQSGARWAAWFTGAEPAGIYAARSPDGEHFEPRELVVSFEPNPVRHPELGELPNGRLIVLYETTHKNGTTPIEFRERDPKTGVWSAAHTLALAGKYPRFARPAVRSSNPNDDPSAVAFTCVAGESTRIAVATWDQIALGTATWPDCDDRQKQKGDEHSSPHSE